jgi:hypothetical protein
MNSRQIFPRMLFWALIVCAGCVTFLPAQRTTNVPQHASSAQHWQTQTDNRLSSIEVTLSSIQSEATKTADVSTHLTQIEKNTNHLKESEWVKTAVPAIISAFSVLVGLWIGNYFTVRLQRERLAQEATLAREDAKSKIGSAVIDWELKQLSLLYGPMRALLGQSMALYRQMNTVLSDSHSEMFRFVPSPSSTDGKMLEMLTSPGEWERFRTVLHISRVYGQGFGIDSYFDEIVSIGCRMVKIIEGQAGYARSEESDLMAIFARYLAHFAVLKHVHENAQKSRDNAGLEHQAATEGPNGTGIIVDLSAVFPEEIHTCINQGFQALTSSIREWREKTVDYS